MKFLFLIAYLIGSMCCGIAHAATCQDLLNAAAQSDANATRDVGTGAQLLRQAAQRYRDAYNANCTGSRGGGSSGGGSGAVDKGAAINQIMNGLVGIAAILERKRQREEAEAQEAAMQADLQRIQQETEEAQRKTQADQAAAAAKAADDKKRRSLVNPFGDNATSGVVNPFKTIDELKPLGEGDRTSANDPFPARTGTKPQSTAPLGDPSGCATEVKRFSAGWKYIRMRNNCKHDIAIYYFTGARNTYDLVEPGRTTDLSSSGANDKFAVYPTIIGICWLRGQCPYR